MDANRREPRTTPINAPAGHSARQKNRGIQAEASRIAASSRKDTQPPGEGTPIHSGRTAAANARCSSGSGSSQPT